MAIWVIAARPHPGVQSHRCSPAPPAVSRISISTTSCSEASSSSGVFGAPPADTIARLRGRRNVASWCKLESPREGGGLHHGHREASRRCSAPDAAERDYLAPLRL